MNKSQNEYFEEAWELLFKDGPEIFTQCQMVPQISYFKALCSLAYICGWNESRADLERKRNPTRVG